MSHATLIKPTHKSIADYYRTLQETAAQGADHEMAIRRAFRELLATTARIHDWTIIEEETHVTEGKGNVRPDATFRDKNTLPRGYWEAKDTADDLAAEVRKKKAKGYSLVNTIFEDTRNAILYQNGQPHPSSPFTLTDPESVSGFPELAKGLVSIAPYTRRHASASRFSRSVSV